MQSKFFLKSMTVWGLLIAAAPTFLGDVLGIDVPLEVIQAVGRDVTNTVTHAVEFYGLFQAAIGARRSDGSTKLTLKPN